MLRAELRKLRAGFNAVPAGVMPPDNDTRFRRCLSWLGAAEKAENEDTRLIYLWIAFNALYGEESMLRPKAPRQQERDSYRALIQTVSRFDRDEGGVFTALESRKKDWQVLLDNPYTFHGYWETIAEQEGESADWETCPKCRDFRFLKSSTVRAEKCLKCGRLRRKNWQTAFVRAQKNAQEWVQKRQTRKLLCEVCDRLYELRSQIFHGGAAFTDIYNRSQVTAAARVLAATVPAVAAVMLARHKHNWGAVMSPPQGTPNEMTGKARPLRAAPPAKKQPL